jgi:hypothetical protein
VLGNALNTIGLGLRTFLAGVADSPGPIRLAIGLGCVIAVASHIIARWLRALSRYAPQRLRQALS